MRREYRRGLNSSGVMFCFWLLLCLINIVSFRTRILAAQQVIDFDYIHLSKSHSIQLADIYIWSILTNMVQIQKIKVFALYSAQRLVSLCLWYSADAARKKLQMEPYFYMPVLNIIDFRGQKLFFLVIT